MLFFLFIAMFFSANSLPGRRDLSRLDFAISVHGYLDEEGVGLYHNISSSFLRCYEIGVLTNDGSKFSIFYFGGGGKFRWLHLRMYTSIGMGKRDKDTINIILGADLFDFYLYLDFSSEIVTEGEGESMTSAGLTGYFKGFLFNLDVDVEALRLGIGYVFEYN